MRPSIALQTHRDEIREIALSHRVNNVRVFGSALYGDDTEDSDLDFLVDPTPETTLMDIAKIQVEIARLPQYHGRCVDAQVASRQMQTNCYTGGQTAMPLWYFIYRQTYIPLNGVKNELRRIDRKITITPRSQTS